MSISYHFDTANLESRMVVECHNGERFIVIRMPDCIVGMNCSGTICIDSSNFDEHLKNIRYGIDKVFPQVKSLDQINTVQSAI